MNNEQKVRLDLLDKSILLKTLGSLIKVKNFTRDFNEIVFAAPHNAKSKQALSDGHDVSTGYIAEKLAKNLKAKCVIATELRTFIDLNKYPWADEYESITFSPAAEIRSKASRLMKLFYQSQIFHDIPRLITEIHGHTSGNYDIEIAPGFSLSMEIKRDVIFLDVLKNLKNHIYRQIKKKWAYKNVIPSIGISPIDEDVHFTATSTYTFEKVEKLRELGVNIYGLHIEIHKKLRESLPSSLTNDLIDILSDAIKNSVFSLIDKKLTYDLKEKLFDDFIDISSLFKPTSDFPLTTFKVPRKYSSKGVVIMSSQDMKRLDISEGEEILISPSEEPGEVIKAPVIRENCRRGSILMNKKMREDLSIETSDTVFISKIKLSKKIPKQGELCYVSSVDEKLPGYIGAISGVMLETIKKKKIMKNGMVNLFTRQGKNADVSIKKSGKLQDFEIHVRLPVAKDTEITCGDVILIREPISLGKFSN